MIRIGFGYDIHRLVKNRELIIGGIKIPHPKGEDGYSDGDVLIHAVIDALLGAAGLKDIGTFFPPGDPAYKNISSRILLRKTMELITGKSYKIVNIDCTVILELPKLKPYIDDIIQSLCGDLGINTMMLSVKAKTKEKIGFTGRGKAIESYAVVLLESINPGISLSANHT